MHYNACHLQEMIRNTGKGYLHLIVAKHANLPGKFILSVFRLAEGGDCFWFDCIVDDRKSHSAELDFFTRALQVSKTHRRLNPELLETFKYLEYYPKDSVVKFLEVACPILTVETLHQLAENPCFVKRLVPDLNPNLITHSILGKITIRQIS